MDIMTWSSDGKLKGFMLGGMDELPLAHGMAWGGRKSKAMTSIFSAPPPNALINYSV